MKCRTVIRLAILGLSAFAALPSAQAIDCGPWTEFLKRNLVSISKPVLERGDEAITLVGEMHDGFNEDPTFYRTIFGSHAAGGPDCVFLELPTEYQPDLDLLTKGKASLPTIAKRMLNDRELVMNQAGARGSGPSQKLDALVSALSPWVSVADRHADGKELGSLPKLLAIDEPFVTTINKEKFSLGEAFASRNQTMANQIQRNVGATDHLCRRAVGIVGIAHLEVQSSKENGIQSIPRILEKQGFKTRTVVAVSQAQFLWNVAPRGCGDATLPFLKQGQYYRLRGNWKIDADRPESFLFMANHYDEVGDFDQPLLPYFLNSSEIDIFVGKTL